MGVVYYANYLRFFEAARNSYCREKKIPYRELEDRGLILPVTQANTRYLSPALYDDLLRVDTTIPQLGRASLRFAYKIYRVSDERLLAEGFTDHACLKRGGRVTRLPKDLIEAFSADPDPQTQGER